MSFQAQNTRDIGLLVRFHRKKTGLTQKELADLAGVGKTALFDIEKGKQTVRLDTLMKVLMVLNVHLAFEGPLMERFTQSFIQSS